MTNGGHGRFRLALAVLGVLLAACVESSGPEPKRPRPNAQETIDDTADDVRRPRAKSRFPIEHVIILTKENRTFDYYFARYPGADGATHGKLSTG